MGKHPLPQRFLWRVGTIDRHRKQHSSGGQAPTTDAVIAVAGGRWQAALGASPANAMLLVPAVARHSCSSDEAHNTDKPCHPPFSPLALDLKASTTGLV